MATARRRQHGSGWRLDGGARFTARRRLLGTLRASSSANASTRRRAELRNEAREPAQQEATCVRCEQEKFVAQPLHRAVMKLEQ